MHLKKSSSKNRQSQNPFLKTRTIPKFNVQSSLFAILFVPDTHQSR